MKVGTNNYEGYSNYFTELRNDHETSINFRVVISKLMKPTAYLYNFFNTMSNFNYCANTLHYTFL